MTFSSAYLLVAHGSRHPRPQLELSQLARLCEQVLEQKFQRSLLKIPEKLYVAKMGTSVIEKPPSILVGTATLEFASLSLHQQIERFAHRCQQNQCQRMQIIPLFLAPGVHVREDIPAEIASAKKTLKDEITLDLQPHLGAAPGLSKLLAAQFASNSAESKIILAHGSRRLGANQSIEDLAASLDSSIAYWTVSPTLSTTIARLSSTGVKKAVILPYFLFNGRITCAIAQEIQELETNFPSLELTLLPPLGATTALAQLIVEEI